MSPNVGPALVSLLLRSSVAAIAAGTLIPAAASAQEAPAPTDAGGTQPEDAEGTPAAASGRAAAEEIVVTGSRLRSGFTTPTPVTVVGADEIARQGVSNVAEVLNQVPAFRPQNTPSTTAIFVSNLGASTADLRGLGANRTLVLIDGRRVVASTVQGGSFTPANTVDLNLVPTALIARSEVVTGGASAAYGSDAVAGVVNLILDKDLTGLRGHVQYGQADAGDTEEYVVSLAGGFRFADGRGRAIAGVEYVDNQGSGGCYSRDWCAQSYNTVSVPASSPLRQTLPGIVIMPDARTATATRNGIIVGGPLRGTEFNPDGTTFQHDYGTYYGAGIFQSGGGDPRLAFYEHFAISAPVERLNGFAHVDFEASDNLTLFAEGSYGRVEGEVVGAQRRDVGPFTIRADNPFLPDSIRTAIGPDGTIAMGRIWNDIGPQLGEVRRETMRFLGGFTLAFGGNWTLDGYYQYGQTDYRQRGHNTTINSRMARALDVVAGPGGQPICRALLSPDPAVVSAAQGCQPLNPFGEGSPSAAAIDYVTGTARQDSKLTQHVAALTLRGDLVELWAGPLTVAAGAEYREDKATGTTDPISAANDFYTSPGSAINGKIDVKEAFFEAGLPLARDLPFARLIELNGAVRLTDYSSTGTATTWKVGAVWEPTEWLRFRGTRSRDIRAPNLFELFAPPQGSFQSITDPLNGGAQFLPRVFLSGNPNLRNEVADTWTIGVVLQPDVPGVGRVRLAVDWFDIALDDAIATLGGQIVVNRCSANPPLIADCDSLVVRDADNVITAVFNSNLNLNRLIARGIDSELSFSVPLDGISAGSRLNIRALGTWMKDLITIDSSGIAVDRAGMNGSPVSQPSGLPRWQLNGFFTYDAEPFSAQVQVRYISKGRYNTTLIGPDEEGYSPTLPNSISDNAVGSMVYVNLNAQYTLWERDGRTVQIYGAINNLFDRDPPKDIPSSFGPTNNVLYDVIGRYFRIGARFTL